MNPKTTLAAALSIDAQIAYLADRARSHRREVWCDVLGMGEIVGWGYTLTDGNWTLTVAINRTFTVTLVNTTALTGEKAPVHEKDLTELEAFELVDYLLGQAEAFA